MVFTADSNDAVRSTPEREFSTPLLGSFLVTLLIGVGLGGVEHMAVRLCGIRARF